MGLIRAKIKLTNASDIALCGSGYLEETEIKSTEVESIIDKQAYTLAINQNIKTQLGLRVVDTQPATLADGQNIMLELVGPIEVRFDNRRTVCEAMVLPGNAEVLLGAIPMEAMDVVINPREEKLEVNPLHPYKPNLSLR